MAQRKRSDINFEESLQKLEAIVKRLEEEEIPLETSLKLFAEGQTLARACEQQLKTAENQIRQLLEKNSGEIEEVELPETPSGEAESAGTDEPAGTDGTEDPPPAPAPSPKGDSGNKPGPGSDDLPF